MRYMSTMFDAKLHVQAKHVLSEQVKVTTKGQAILVSSESIHFFEVVHAFI